MKYYKIPENRLRDFIESEEILTALQDGGVDNWSWYGESLYDYYKAYSDENNLEEYPPDLEIETIVDNEIKRYEVLNEDSIEEK